MAGQTKEKHRLTIYLDDDVYQKVLQNCPDASKRSAKSKAINDLIRRAPKRRKPTSWVLISSEDGNCGDLLSEVSIPLYTWEKIKRGETVRHKGEGWYEGEHFPTYWVFENGEARITMDSRTYGYGNIAEKPIDKLLVME